LPISSSVAFDELREFARRKEVPVFSIGLDSGGVIESLFPARPPRRDPGGGRPGWPGPGPGRGPGGRWPGGGGRLGRGWRGGVGRTGGPGSGPAIPGGGGGGGGFRGPRRGFDEKPLLELADDTGGRAGMARGRRHEWGG